MGYLGIMKLHSMRFVFFLLWDIQKVCRFLRNGKVYPSKAERDYPWHNNGRVCPAWHCPGHFGRFAYSTFGTFKCGHLVVELFPYRSSKMRTYAHYGTKSQTSNSLSVKELESYLKYW